MPQPASVAADDFDVLIIGAGLSGIDAGCHLARKMPHLSYAILEGRERLGGTWDLFRYPGIRSDADMYTFGYGFRPWRKPKDIADARDILEYLGETAREFGVDRHIRYQNRVVAANWSSADKRWTLQVNDGVLGRIRTLRCRFLVTCTGYYSYERGYLPEWPGFGDFKGEVAHPQHWPEELEYAGKRIIVIGSGATAITLIPNLARKAGKVTMLQRTPTYIYDRPAIDPIAAFLNRWLPEALAFRLIRAKNVLLTLFLFDQSRRSPEKVKAFLMNMARKALGPDFEVDKHFNPPYNPWDQRLCMIPDSDLFTAINEGRAEVVTGHIDHFTPDGVLLKDGTRLEADLVVPATGLRLKLLEGMNLSVDDRPVNFPDHLNYRGMMFNDIPNFVSVFGYTNAPWTLKADLTCGYICRLLRYMERKGHTVAMPTLSGQLDRDSMTTAPIVDLSSGYIQRALAELPRQGDRMPWRNHDNYLKDRLAIRFGRLNDGVMRFSK